MLLCFEYPVLRKKIYRATIYPMARIANNRHVHNKNGLKINLRDLLVTISTYEVVLGASSSNMLFWGVSSGVSTFVLIFILDMETRMCVYA